MGKSVGWKVLVALAVLVIAVGIVLGLLDRRSAPNAQPPAAIPTDPQSRPSRALASGSIPPEETSGLPEDQLAKFLALKLPRDAIEEHLRRHNRSARNLLAAYLASRDASDSVTPGDMNYLKEAARSFPDESRVQWAVVVRNAFPEEQRQWLEAFKASSPSNSLANYLSARHYFQDGKPNAAVRELLDATAKAQFDDFRRVAFSDLVELYQAGGKSLLESSQAALGDVAGSLLPESATLKALALSVRDLQKQYATAGDTGSVENLSQCSVALARRFSDGDGGNLIISQLVGMAIEAIALAPLNSDTNYAFLGGRTPHQRQEELKQQKNSLKEATARFHAAFPNLSESELMSYQEQARVSGELAAMRWLLDQRGANPPGRSP